MDARAAVVMTSVDSEELAAAVAAELLDRRLAACVQQLAIRSRYRWEGRIQAEQEILLLAKTSAKAAEAAVEAIRRVHSYEVPEILVLPVSGGLPAYLAWIEAETGDG